MYEQNVNNGMVLAWSEQVEEEKNFHENWTITTIVDLKRMHQPKIVYNDLMQ